MSAYSQYDRQFLAWALDRALRYFEVTENKTATPDQAITLAECFCAWIQPAQDAPEPKLPEPTPEELAAQDEHDKHINGGMP